MNYFPVTSAIAIRDSKLNRQLTVMNDRAQGGSAEISKNTVELMHNRRLVTDDMHGVNEVLNETLSNGHGLKVTGKYWVNIFDT